MSIETSPLSAVGVQPVVRQIELDKPWLCECGKEHELGYYVAAHWDDLLTHTCECGRKHTLESGVLTLVNSDA